MLGPLGYNGGAVPTVSVLAGSRAIDAGGPTGAPAVNARGELRVTGSAIDIDIDAVERQNGVVTTTNDSGPGSLRQAIAQDRDGSTIAFDASLSDKTITLKSQLTITSALTIDGANAPRFDPERRVGQRVPFVGATSATTLHA